MNLSVEILRRGNLQEVMYEILFTSYFLFADSISRVEMLRVIVRGKFSLGSNRFERAGGGGRFFVEMDPDFSALFNKPSECKYIKKVFFLLKVRRNIKTENEHKLLLI